MPHPTSLIGSKTILITPKLKTLQQHYTGSVENAQYGVLRNNWKFNQSAELWRTMLVPSEVSLRFNYVKKGVFLHLGSVDFQRG